MVTPRGLIIVQYLGKHAECGDAIAVHPSMHKESVSVSEELLRGGYVTFYPAVVAVGHELASIVGRRPSSGIPERMRLPGARHGLKVATWILEGDKGAVMTERLSAQERDLPIGVIGHHQYLVDRVAEGWRPEVEGRDD